MILTCLFMNVYAGISGSSHSKASAAPVAVSSGYRDPFDKEAQREKERHARRSNDSNFDSSGSSRHSKPSQVLSIYLLIFHVFLRHVLPLYSCDKLPVCCHWYDDLNIDSSVSGPTRTTIASRDSGRRACVKVHVHMHAR